LAAAACAGAIERRNSMSKRTFLLAVCVVLGLVAWPALAMNWWEEEQTEAVQRTQGVDTQGTSYEAITNWEDGYVEVEAIGTTDVHKTVNAAQAKMMAEDAARVRAYSQLAEVVAGFNITSEITVENGLIGRSEQRMQLSTFLKGAKVISSETAWLPDGTPLSTVKVGIVLARNHPGIGASPPAAPQKPVSLAEVIHPMVEAAGRQVESESSTTHFQPAEVPAITTDYTGLIIDARGLDGSPSLAPRILAEEGSEVWAFANAEPDYAMLYGVVDWAHNMDSARSKSRVGQTPMVISAHRAVGPKAETVFKSDFVISDRDAAFLLAANKGPHFLEKCGVVIII
jgi:hypothetical protein